ncbi:MAG TPA: anaerobic glycerol-3-phosphate dehydrogenase subunit GlpB, partial [Aggregatilineales bacterium]|nr:anaerobic glycerol-3-phosphate dehydrogenase subunit GlpB [Aggregatilineales bacterium]
MNYDTIVIGAGYAGLTAALKLAQGGQKVLLLATGYGATHLRTGAIDILGYHADQRVTNPLEAVAELASSQPDHPYARVPAGALQEAVTFFTGAMAEAGYPFDGSPEANCLMPTAIGVARPVALVPHTMVAGQLQAGRAYVIVGFSNFKDFYPELLADNLQCSYSGIQARGATITAPGFENRADIVPMDLARAFDRPEFRAKLADALKPKLKSDERVGFPAVLGLDQAGVVLDDLRSRLSAEVFEIPTLPPSIPGIRIYQAFEGLLRKRGVRMQIGQAVGAVQTHDHQVEAVVVETVVRPVVYRAASFVLATGGIVGGGL